MAQIIAGGFENIVPAEDASEEPATVLPALRLDDEGARKLRLGEPHPGDPPLEM